MTKRHSIKPWIQTVALKHTSNECLMWPFNKVGNGYGQLSHEGTMVLSHRYILHLVSGEDLSTPLEVMHSCHTPGCVNPHHLSWGTRSENRRDQLNNNSYGFKLTPEQALGIYNAKGSQREIAEIFGVDRSTVSDIKTGKVWSIVTGQTYTPTFLTEEAVLAIYHAKGSHRAIAKMFGVSPKHVSRIKRGKSRAKVTKHLREPNEN